MIRHHHNAVEKGVHRVLEGCNIEERLLEAAFRQPMLNTVVYGLEGGEKPGFAIVFEQAFVHSGKIGSLGVALLGNA